MPINLFAKDYTDSFFKEGTKQRGGNAGIFVIRNEIQESKTKKIKNKPIMLFVQFFQHII